MTDKIDDIGLDGSPIAQTLTKGVLGQQFGVPPFSVLNAMKGEWQERKRRWLELGIQSELGRGGNLLSISDSCEEYRQRAGNYASPGGSPRPACDYSNKDRGDGAGKPIRKHTDNLKGGLVFKMTMIPYADQHGWKPPSAPPEPGLFEEHADATEISAANSGTSIFDPVLCELMYRWFCPPGGQIVDPFAGGSVRGVTAAVLGRRYWGCDLSTNQVRANYIQAQQILWKDSRPAVRQRGPLRIIDDAHLPGGTKMRALVPYLVSQPDCAAASEIAYAGPREGFAQLAVAIACQITGKKAVLFVPKAKVRHRRTVLAAQAGAQIIEVDPGYLTNLKKKAADWACNPGRVLLPFGLANDSFRSLLGNVVKGMDLRPNVPMWVTGGSGTLASAIRLACPTMPLNVVRVGAELNMPGVTDRFRVHNAPEAFPADAKTPPPYEATSNYDAKIWQFAQKQQGPAYVWNVAGNNPHLFWANGDSANHLPDAPDADMIFGCPPYGDLEVYSDDPNDLSNMDPGGFAEAYTKIIGLACARLREDRFAVFVVGDYRNPKTGEYRDFPGLTIRAFKKAGLKYHNECILLTAVGSLPVRVRKQFDNSRKLGKTHQNVLVFVKGDPVRATAAIRGE